MGKQARKQTNKQANKSFLLGTVNNGTKMISEIILVGRKQRNNYEITQEL